MKKWRCTVCGYIHTGDEPPEKCPVCGADRSKFVEVAEAEAASAKGVEKAGDDTPAPAADKPSGVRHFITDMMIRHHVHPISVHVPNGVIPLVFLFVAAAELFHSGSMARAAFYNSVAVLLSLPLVLFSGYNEWQNKYGGHLTTRFVVKISAALIVTATCLAAVIWYLLDPMILESGSSGGFAFLLLNLILLAATGVAGFIGGKLVFKD